MRMNLDALEVRVLGCLMEKELTTPESYPLTVNSLLSACNQKSNRDPVLALSESDVLRALEALGTRGLARLTTTGGRVARYCHSVSERLGLSAAARAVLAELMLRGPQTVGELRNRADRMAELPDLAAVDAILLELQKHGPPLVARLPREAGRKDPRYAQLLSGMPELPEQEEPAAEPQQESAQERRSAGAVPARDRLLRLETEVGALRDDIASLRREIEGLLAQFK